MEWVRSGVFKEVVFSSDFLFSISARVGGKRVRSLYFFSFLAARSPPSYLLVASPTYTRFVADAMARSKQGGQVRRTPIPTPLSLEPFPLLTHLTPTSRGKQPAPNCTKSNQSKSSNQSNHDTSLHNYSSLLLLPVLQTTNLLAYLRSTLLTAKPPQKTYTSPPINSVTPLLTAQPQPPTPTSPPLPRTILLSICASGSSPPGVASPSSSAKKLIV